MFLACIFLTLSVGCVTKGKYKDVEAQRNRALAQRDDLTAQLSEVEAANESLRGELAETEVEVANLRGTYDELVIALQGEVEAGQIEVQQLIDGIRLNVSDELLFPSGSAMLNDKGREVLGRVAGQIKGDNAIISVEGHTDNVPISPSLKSRYPTNWELAGARAASVVRVLSEAGVDPTRMRAVSHGPFAPVASNDTREGRAKNRRTEIILRPLPS
jgi:chemotaxis protein MotB